jgi:hypothetical protein
LPLSKNFLTKIFQKRSLHDMGSSKQAGGIMTKHHRILKTLSLALATTATLAFAPTSPAISAPLQPIDLASQHTDVTSDVVNVAVVVRRGAGVGPRGNAYRYRSTTVVRPGGPNVVRGGAVVVRPGYGGGARWARPGWYRWGPGGAIAAGAALGFVAAGAAVAYGSPPAPGMCWYYTDMTRTQGFWDYCPQ